MSRTKHSLPTVSDCDACGVCCLHMGYPTFLHGSQTQADEEHWISLPAELKAELQQFISDYQASPQGELDGPCFWLDLTTYRCKHHEYRPRVCRDFRVGSQDCLDWRSHYRIT